MSNGEGGHKAWARIYLFYLHLAVKLRGADAIEARLHRVMQQQSTPSGGPALTLNGSERSLLGFFEDSMLDRLCRLNPEDEWANGYERFIVKLPGEGTPNGNASVFYKVLYATLMDLHIIESLPEGVPPISPQDLQDIARHHRAAPWSKQGSPTAATADPRIPMEESVIHGGALGDEEEEYLPGFTSVTGSPASALMSPFGSSTGLSKLSTPSIHSDSLPLVTTTATPAIAPQPGHELGHDDGGRRDRGVQQIVAQDSNLPRPLPPVGHRVDLPAWIRGGGRAGDYPHGQRGDLSYSFIPYSSMPAVAPALHPPPRGAYPANHLRYNRPLSPPCLARVDSVLGRMLTGYYPAPYYSSMSTAPPAYFT